MINLDNTDQANYEVRMSNHRGSRVLNNPRTNLRKFIKGCIENTPPVDSEGQTHNSLIKIDGEGCLTHQVIKEYMQMSKKEVWVDRHLAEAYIKAANLDQVITDDMVNDQGQVKCSVYQSSSQYSGIRSCIVYLYRFAGVAQPEEMSREMSSFMAGMV